MTERRRGIEYTERQRGDCRGERGVCVKAGVHGRGVGTEKEGYREVTGLTREA